MASTLIVFPVREQRESHNPYIFLAVLQVLDVATTWFILHHWSVRAEGNPLMAWLINGAGLGIAMPLMLAFKLGVVYLLWMCQTGAKIASAIYSLIVLNNLLYLYLWATL